MCCIYVNIVTSKLFYIIILSCLLKYSILFYIPFLRLLHIAYYSEISTGVKVFTYCKKLTCIYVYDKRCYIARHTFRIRNMLID